MDKVLTIVGNAAAIGGAALCVIAGALRLIGLYTIGGMGADTLFLAGIGGMVFACLAKLQAMSRQRGA